MCALIFAKPALPVWKRVLPVRKPVLPGNKRVLAAKSTAPPGKKHRVPRQKRVLPENKHPLPDQNPVLPDGKHPLPGNKRALPGNPRGPGKRIEGPAEGEVKPFPGRARRSARAGVRRKFIESARRHDDGSVLGFTCATLRLLGARGATRPHPGRLRTDSLPKKATERVR